MKIRLRLRNVQGSIANLVAKERDLLGAAYGVVEHFRKDALAYARSIVPVDTGRMRRSLRAEYVGVQGRTIWALYYDEAVFQSDGVTYYPVFVEFGTSRMAARPTLRRTMERIEDPYRQSLTQAMRRAA